MSFITQTLVEKLKLNKEKTQLSLSGVGGITTNKCTSRTTLDLAMDQGTIEVKAYDLQTITGCILSKPLDISRLTSLMQYSLADPNFNTSASVDLLLGADIFEKLNINQREKISPGLFHRKTFFRLRLCWPTRVANIDGGFEFSFVVRRSFQEIQ